MIMKKSFIILLVICLTILSSACKNTNEQVETKEQLTPEPSVTQDTLPEKSKPFENLISDDVTEIKIMESSLKSEITLSEDDSLHMIELINKLVITRKAEEEVRLGQMVQIILEKADNTSVTLKCFSPYLIIDDVWCEAEYEPLENVDQFANEIMKRS